MTLPLIVLGVATLGIGAWNTPFRFSFEHFLEPSFEGVPHPEPIDWTLFVVLASFILVIAVIGLAWAWWRYTRDPLPAEDGSFWRNALAAFHVDDFYGKYIVAPGNAIATWFAEFVDPRVIDGAAHGIGAGVRESGKGGSTLQTGQVRWYASGMAFAGVVLVVLFLLFGGGV